MESLEVERLVSLDYLWFLTGATDWVLMVV